MPATYEPIATTTLGSASASVTFSNISQAYTDLVLIIQATYASSLTAATAIQVGNGSIDTGSNYSMTWLYGDGSSAGSFRLANRSSMGTYFVSTPPTLRQTIFQFQNYSNTTTNKTVLMRSGATDSGTEAFVGLWRSTSAINTIKVILDRAGNFEVGSTFTLYGIKAA